MNKQLQPTTQELKQAIAAMLIVFAKHMPPAAASHLAHGLEQMAHHLHSNGEPNVGTLIADFGKALNPAPSKSPKNH